MPDNLTPSQRKTCMSRIRGTNTKPELQLRKELWHRGFRYLVNDKRLPGKPDLVLPKYRTVVFVHGCFWHGHKGCAKFVVPKTNEEYWIPKLSRNQQRDQEVWRQLEAKGWYVIVVWECQLKKDVFQSTIDAVSRDILKNGEIYLMTMEARKHSREEYLKNRRLIKQREKQLLSELREGALQQ